jgi:protein SCO1
MTVRPEGWFVRDIGWARRGGPVRNRTVMTQTPSTQTPKPIDDLPVPRPRMGWLWIGLLALVAVLLATRVLPGLPGLISQQTAPVIGGPFALTDHKGQRVTEAALAGKPYAMFFGYTHCPDVCPTTLQDMTGWLAALGPDAGKLLMVFVTVDPARDTPAALGAYLKAFDPRIFGLTGTEAEIGDMLKSYRVYARKGEVKDGDYPMDHSAAIYLMDRTGELKTVIGYSEKPDVALAKLRDLIGGG